MIAYLVIKSIQCYQRWVGPHWGNRCRFYPSCSEYAILAIRQRGLVSGGIRSAMRILRCNPFHPGGIDIPTADRKETCCG